MPVLFSYRNQSVDLLCKSIEWFLYQGKLAFDALTLPALTHENDSIILFDTVNTFGCS